MVMNIQTRPLFQQFLAFAFGQRPNGPGGLVPHGLAAAPQRRLETVTPIITPASASSGGSSFLANDSSSAAHVSRFTSRDSLASHSRRAAEASDETEGRSSTVGVQGSHVDEKPTTIHGPSSSSASPHGTSQRPFDHVPSKDACCRICLDPLYESSCGYVAPCACSGTSRFVHRACLDRWRKNALRHENFYRCEVCKVQYRIQFVKVPSFLDFAHATPWMDLLPFFCQCVAVASTSSIVLFSSLYLFLKALVVVLGELFDLEGVFFQLLLLELISKLGVRSTFARLGFFCLMVTVTLHLLFGMPLQEAAYGILLSVGKVKVFFSEAEHGLGFGSSFVKHCSSSVAVGVLAGVSAFGIELLRKFRAFQRSHATDKVLDYRGALLPATEGVTSFHHSLELGARRFSSDSSGRSSPVSSGEPSTASPLSSLGSAPSTNSQISSIGAHF